MSVRATVWEPIELAFESAHERDDPYQEVDLRVDWTDAAGRTLSVPGFWDGERTWRARFRPETAGEWRWLTACSDENDPGLHGRSGSIAAVEDPRSMNPLVRHGRVHVAADRRSFAHADGTPFFWLGDTAWNGVLRSQAQEWDAFLTERGRQGFSVVGVFASTWRGFLTDDFGEASFTVTDHVRVNPTIFHRLDARVRAINEHGMLAYVIGVLALYEYEPAWAWPEEELERYIRYLEARWGAYHVVWSPIGDGDYHGQRVDKVSRLCRAAYEPGHRNLVTVHPCGWNLCADEFRAEPWYDFISYQSCHDDTPERLRWHPFGPVPDEWRKDPPRPIVNLEFNYDEHPSFTNRRIFTDREVRRAAYWSLLISPPAGVTYGHYHEWSWSTHPEPVGVAIREQTDIQVGPWTRAIDTPGVRSMTVMRRYFESGPWPRVHPAPDLLTAQPGEADAPRFIAIGQTDDRAWTIAYTPAGDPIGLRGDALPSSASARWFNPRTGLWAGAQGKATGGGGVDFQPPDESDWVLDIRAAEAGNENPS
jgi:hypothetical protein